MGDHSRVRADPKDVGAKSCMGTELADTQSILEN